MFSTSFMLFAISFCVCLATIRLLNPLARRYGWVDKPDKRKQHDGHIPLTGGAGLAIALVATAVGVQGWPPVAYGLALACALIFLVGAADDRVPIRARYRFFAQITAGVAMVFLGDNIIQVLGECFYPGVVGLSILAIPFTIVAIVGTINAYNMSDGLDGLCAGYGLIAMFWFAVAAVSIADTPAYAATALGGLSVIVPLAGALTAFLSLNARSPWRRKASVFLGDGGSMLIGAVIVWCAIFLSQKFGRDGLPPAAAVWLVAVPLSDMFICMIRRILAGQTPMTPDRRHLHHLLLERGHTPAGAVWRLHLLSFLCGSIGIVGWLAEVPEYVLFWSLILVFSLVCFNVLKYWRWVDQVDRQTSNSLLVSTQIGPRI